MGVVIINMPAAWPGTRDEIAANRATHLFSEGGNSEVYCMACECKPWHVGADWPCGSDPPRVVRCTLCIRQVAHTHTAREAEALRTTLH